MLLLGDTKVMGTTSVDDNIVTSYYFMLIFCMPKGIVSPLVLLSH